MVDNYGKLGPLSRGLQNIISSHPHGGSIKMETVATPTAAGSTMKRQYMCRQSSPGGTFFEVSVPILLKFTRYGFCEIRFKQNSIVG